MVTGELSTDKRHCLKVTWKIRDFSSKPTEADCCLRSPYFTLAESVWRLTMFPNGRTWGESEGYIDMFLKRFRHSVPRQKVTMRFCLMSDRGKEHKSYSTKELFDEDDDAWGVKNFIRRKKLEDDEHFLPPHDTLIVHCLIIVQPACSEDELPRTPSPKERIGTEAFPCIQHDAFTQTEVIEACIRSEAVPGTSSKVIDGLQSDYKKLLESEEEADVCLRVSDKEFRTHKCILKARSSVFSAMFQRHTHEKARDEVVIEDLDPECFPNFLQHMYSGNVDTLSEENVFNLYEAADRYDMADLKSECKSYMVRILSVDSFCDVLLLALRHQEDDLLKSAVDFFGKNLTRIILTVKWMKLAREYDTVAHELLVNALAPEQES